MLRVLARVVENFVVEDAILLGWLLFRWSIAIQALVSATIAGILNAALVSCVVIDLLLEV